MHRSHFGNKSWWFTMSGLREEFRREEFYFLPVKFSHYNVKQQHEEAKTLAGPTSPVPSQQSVEFHAAFSIPSSLYFSESHLSLSRAMRKGNVTTFMFLAKATHIWLPSKFQSRANMPGILPGIFLWCVSTKPWASFIVSMLLQSVGRSWDDSYLCGKGIGVWTGSVLCHWSHLTSVNDWQVAPNILLPVMPMLQHIPEVVTAFPSCPTHTEICFASNWLCPR